MERNEHNTCTCQAVQKFYINKPSIFLTGEGHTKVDSHVTYTQHDTFVAFILFQLFHSMCSSVFCQNRAVCLPKKPLMWFFRTTTIFLHTTVNLCSSNVCVAISKTLPVNYLTFFIYSEVYICSPGIRGFHQSWLLFCAFLQICQYEI